MENELKYRQPLTHMTLHRHPKYPLGKYSSIGEAESKCFTMRKVILFVSRLRRLYKEIVQLQNKTSHVCPNFSSATDFGKNL